jgi:hypothetical protein
VSGPCRPAVIGDQHRGRLPGTFSGLLSITPVRVPKKVGTANWSSAGSPGAGAGAGAGAGDHETPPSVVR